MPRDVGEDFDQVPGDVVVLAINHELQNNIQELLVPEYGGVVRFVKGGVPENKENKSSLFDQMDFARHFVALLDRVPLELGLVHQRVLAHGVEDQVRYWVVVVLLDGQDHALYQLWVAVDELDIVGQLARLEGLSCLVPYLRDCCC